MQIDFCGKEELYPNPDRVHPRQLVKPSKKTQEEIWNKWFSRVRLLTKHVRLEVPKSILQLHPCKCERAKQPKERLFVYRTEPGFDLQCMHCNKKIELIT